MKTKIIFTVFVALIFSVSIFAQNQKEEKIKLPELYLEQKLDRSVMNLSAVVLASIACVKSLGMTSEEYGKFVGNIFAPGWQAMKGEGAAAFVRGMYRNVQADKEVKWEIISESENSITVKINRFGNYYVKDFKEPGVSMEEYDKCWGAMMKTIAISLGFEFSQKYEGDHSTFTVSQF
jgi:phosphate/sulfate permease